VKCTDVFVPVFKEQVFGKLVRDRIPLEIERRGERVFSRPLAGEDLTKFLRAKAVEEALELQSATSIGELLEELADLYEIILSLAERHGSSISEVSNKAESKRNQRGSFREGLVLLETREVPLLDQRRSSIRLTGRRAGLMPAMLDAEEGTARITTERGPRYENGQIIMPLVPPNIRDAVLRVEGLDVVFKVRYENKEIVIQWTQEAPQVPANQLRLI
jgi:predicted house-cleaning noncanonical NTP pyrophosphatase (MazG superfamily)